MGNKIDGSGQGLRRWIAVGSSMAGELGFAPEPHLKGNFQEFQGCANSIAAAYLIDAWY